MEAASYGSQLQLFLNQLLDFSGVSNRTLALEDSRAAGRDSVEVTKGDARLSFHTFREEVLK
jgi:hypothetical protein